MRLELGALSLPLAIGSTGLFVTSDNNATADVTITLPAGAPLRAMTDRPSLFAAARISGSAELAESLGFVFRNLSWDVESESRNWLATLPHVGWCPVAGNWPVGIDDRRKIWR